MKFKLSRKRKKQYKKDLEKNNKSYKDNASWMQWENFYFKRRVDVKIMNVILSCTETGETDEETGIWTRYENPVVPEMNNELLLQWYKKHYPEDKEAHHYCKQNRNKYN